VLYSSAKNKQPPSDQMLRISCHRGRFLLAGGVPFTWNL